MVDDLSRQLPGLKTFVTLSPIPGLAGWVDEQGLGATVTQENLQALAAHYLLNAKRSDGAPLDPVARFHLGNGAMIHAVHATADTSESGQAQSYGAMVNYLYDLSANAQNHEGFADSFAVAASADVKALARAAKKNETKGTI